MMILKTITKSKVLLLILAMLVTITTWKTGYQLGIYIGNLNVMVNEHYQNKPLDDRSTIRSSQDYQKVTKPSTTISSTNYNRPVVVGNDATVDDSSSSSSAKRQRTIPDFSNGGIILYYHTYKTGGSTIRQLYLKLQSLQQQSSSDDDNDDGYYSASDSTQKQQHDHNYKLDDITTTIKNKTTNSNKIPPIIFESIRKEFSWEEHCSKSLRLASKGQLVILNLHPQYPSPQFPSLVEIQSILLKWRHVAKADNIPFFTFTTIREPIAHTLSFFNFFHVASDSKEETSTKKSKKRRQIEEKKRLQTWNPFQYLDATESNLQRSLVDNRQCLLMDIDVEGILATPDLGLRETPKLLKQYMLASIDMNETTTKTSSSSSLTTTTKTTKFNCRFDIVKQTLLETMDWIGTTEKLQNETLPLLSYMIANDATIGQNHESYKTFTDRKDQLHGLSKDTISKKLTRYIQYHTKDDRQLYNMVLHKYHYHDYILYSRQKKKGK